MARIYRVPFDRAAQINRWLRRNTAGALVGQSESASPVRLDHPAKISRTSQNVSGDVLIGSSGSTFLAVFTSSGTWTKPAGARFVRIYALGGGAGGSSGRVTGTGVAAIAGAAGGGGGTAIAMFAAADLPASLTVTVGAGGTGGAATTGNTSTAGAAGTDSTVSSGGVFYARGPGALSQNAGGSVGVGTFSGFNGGPGGAALNGSGGSAPFSNYPALMRNNGGGGGGGVTSGNVAGSGFAITAFVATTDSPLEPGAGGSGGNGALTGNGGTGSNGQIPSGGGGGGGSARTGNNSGAGGNGARGLVVIVTSL